MDSFVVRLQWLPVILVVWVVALVAHEVGHAAAALWMGDPTAKRAGRLTLNPLKHIDPYGTGLVVVTWLLAGFLFGWAKPVPISPFYFNTKRRLKLALISFAGPLMNFILAIVLLLIWNAVHPAVDSWGYDVFLRAYALMLLLGLFNLIPIPPLDGSRIFAAVLPRKAYARWVQLDQYGIFLVVLVAIAFSRQLSDLFGAALNGIAGPFLTNY